MKRYSTILLVSLLFHLGFCQESGNYSMEEFCEELSDNLTKLCLPPYHDCPNPDFCKPSEGNNLGLAFGLTIGAGLSTNLGALLSFLPCFKRSNVTLLAVGLSLAAGFMVYIAFVDILGKTGEYFCCHTQTHYNLAATGCFFMGILLTLMLQFLLDGLQKLDIGCSPPWSKKMSQEEKFTAEDDGGGYSKMLKSLKSKIMGGSSQDEDTDISSTKKEKLGGISNPTKVVIESEVESESSGALKKLDDALDSSEIVCVTEENEEKPDDIEEAVGTTGEYDDVMELLGKDSKNLHRMGLFTAASIAIHNFPEGIATFIVGLATPILGVALAVAIALHNIPEGASVAIPIYYATGKKWKGLFWAFLSGMSEPFGALLAFLIFKDIFGPLAYGFIFGFVGGMMVIVALKDLLPTARKFDQHGNVVTTFFILGMFVMAASLVFFEY